MVVTEAPAEAAVDAPSGATADTGPAALLGTVGHVAIGKLFVVASLLFLVVSRVADALIGAERLDVGEVTILDDFELRIDLLHRLGTSFLFIIPAFLGLAIAVVPLQVGSPTIAFPRGAAVAFWGWFLSGGVLLASFFVDGSAWQSSGGEGARLFFIGFGGVLASLVLATVCVLTTILALRTAGMTVDRVPMFSWGLFVAGTVWLAALPVALGVVALNYLDLTYQSGLGAFGSLEWAFGPTMAFAVAFPLVGVLLDVVPVAAGTRLRNRGVLLGAVAAGGILTFAADQISAVTPDSATFQDALYVGGSIAFVLPLLAILGGVADTLRRGGKPKLSSPLVMALLGFLLLLAAAVANGVRVIDNLDLTGTSADTAVSGAALVAGILGVGAGLHHWSTKVFGSQLKEGVGTLAAVVLFLGGLLLAAPDLVSGFLDQGVGLRPELPIEDGVEALNGVSALGAVVVLLGGLLVILNLVAGRGGDDDGDVPADPWGGHTLEWATTSPPAPGGPGPLEPVTSPEPLLDLKGGDA